MLDTLATFFAVKKGSLLAGFFGAVLSARFIPAMTKWYERLLMIAGGFLFTIYTSPALTELLELKERTETGVTFLLSVFGMSLVSAIYEPIASGKLWDAINKRFFGGGN
jgi:hypothetical protein